jgi:predicted RNA binding protein YcfA (HicA-like mRNA interferase family)
MTKLVELSFGEVCSIIEDNGFELERQTTHSALYVHPEDRSRRAPVPRHKRIAKGTLRSIIRRSRKPREDFAR